jgi:S1-C subfamily serine protease
MYVSNFNPGDKIKVKVVRDGKPLELEVTLAERPPNAQ